MNRAEKIKKLEKICRENNKHLEDNGFSWSVANKQERKMMKARENTIPLLFFQEE